MIEMYCKATLNLSKFFLQKKLFLTIFGMPQRYGSEPLQIASHLLKMNMAMPSDLANAAVPSLWLLAAECVRDELEMLEI